MRVNPVFVIAGNYQQFRDFVRLYGKADPQRYRYVANADYLRGIRCSEKDILYYGTWSSRRDIEEIEMHVKLVTTRYS